jgi:hypothetical protein
LCRDNSATGHFAHQREASENPTLWAKHLTKQKNFKSYFWLIQLDIA